MSSDNYPVQALSAAEPADHLRPAYLQSLRRLELACCALLACLLVWKGILPAWQTLNTDFPNYYLVARLLHEGSSLDRIYDWIWLQRIKDHWGLHQPLVGFAGLTPFSALPIVPLTICSALAAKRIWIVVNLLFLGATAELLHRSTALGRRRVWALCLLAIVPLRTSFLYGQMHLIVLLLLTLAWFFYRRNQSAACGICIALASALKVYPLLFLAYFVWKKQYRTALATFCATILVIFIGYQWMGGSVLHIYTTQILPRSLQGEVLDPYNLGNASASAFLHRLFLYEPSLNPAPLLYSPTLYALIYPLWQLAVFLPLFAMIRPSPASADRTQLEWSAFLFALLLVSPVPSSYHFVVMILSMVLLIDVLVRRNHYQFATLAISLYLLISLCGQWPLPDHLPAALLTFLSFGRLWLSILLFAVILLCLRRIRERQSTAWLGRMRATLLYSGTAIAYTLAVAGYRAHFAHLPEEMSRYIVPAAATYLATAPQAQSGSTFFIGMGPEGYDLTDEQNHRLYSQANAQQQVDQLTFAIAPDRSVLLELADTSGSRIVQVPTDPTTAPAHTLIQDAESPALSPDGHTLAFIRELNGRGTLWITRLVDGNSTNPTQLTDNSYDVRHVSILGSGQLLFTANKDGHLRMYREIPGQPPQSTFRLDDEVSFAAPSPDGQLIAFTRLLRNRWQLGYFETSTNLETILTSGDCNAFTPSWSGPRTIAYASDCGRGLGLTGLASINLPGPR